MRTMTMTVLLATGCATAPKATAPSSQNGRQTLRYEVAGVPVIQVVDHSLPTLQITWRFAQGADAEGPAEVGASSLLASLMSRGAAGKTAMEMAEASEKLGASVGGSASRDSISFYASGLSRDLGAISQLLADTVRRPNLEEAEFDRLKRQTLAGMKSSRNRGSNLAQKAFQRLLYGDDRLGRPVDGDEKSVEALTTAQLKALHGRALHPGQLTIGVFGDADPAAVKTLLAEQLKGWKPAAVATTPAPAEAKPRVRIHIVDKPDLTQVNVQLGHVGVARSRKDFEAITLLNYALGGGGFSSRLMKLIRSEKGLTYGVRSSFSAGARPGPFMITTFTRVDKVRELIDLAFGVVDQVAREGITEAELADAKGYYLGSYPLSLETVEGEGAKLMMAKRYGLGDDYVSAYPQRIAAVTTAQVKALAAQLLRRDDLVIVLAGPKDKLIDAVKDLGAVEASWWEDDRALP